MPTASSDGGGVIGSDDTSYSNPVDYIQSDDPFAQSEQPQLPERRPTAVQQQRNPVVPEPMRRPHQSRQLTEPNIPASAAFVDDNYSNPVDLISSSTGADARQQVRVSVSVKRQMGAYGPDNGAVSGDAIDDIYQLPVNERPTHLDIRAGRSNR